jgi:predicted metal-binding protein/GNAT superfamily N-acetyltransferase
MLNIYLYEDIDKEDVINLVLHCQNDGSRPLVGIENQLDLLDIKKNYFSSGGCFWVAKDNEKLVGSIGLMNHGDGIGILKKFFVYEEYRGKSTHLGQKLYNELLTFARRNNFKTLLLDTPKNTGRAHKFYDKAGWKKVSRENLPFEFDYTYQDSDFFLLNIDSLDKENVNMERYLELLIKKGADIATVINTKSIVTAAWTIFKCKFGCGTYGKNLCCPPFAPSYNETQKIIECYSKAILFRTHDISLVTLLAIEVSREMFLDDYYKVIAFGAGGCKKCSECNLDHCNFPGKVVPSMEACGIDVFATVRANNLEIHTIRDSKTIADYFGLILYK